MSLRLRFHVASLPRRSADTRRSHPRDACLCERWASFSIPRGRRHALAEGLASATPWNPPFTKGGLASPCGDEGQARGPAPIAVGAGFGRSPGSPLHLGGHRGRVAVWPYTRGVQGRSPSAFLIIPICQRGIQGDWPGVWRGVGTADPHRGSAATTERGPPGTDWIPAPRE